MTAAADHVPTAVFEPDGDRFVSTVAATGPWDPGVLHGGAVAALLAGFLDDGDRVVSRVLVELLGAVPAAPLRVELGPVDGGRRVARQSAVLHRPDGGDPPRRRRGARPVEPVDRRRPPLTAELGRPAN